MAKPKTQPARDPSIYISAAEILNMQTRAALDGYNDAWPPHVIEHVNTQIEQLNDAGFSTEQDKDEAVAALIEWVEANLFAPPDDDDGDPTPPEPPEGE